MKCNLIVQVEKDFEPVFCFNVMNTQSTHRPVLSFNPRHGERLQAAWLLFYLQFTTEADEKRIKGGVCGGYRETNGSSLTCIQKGNDARLCLTSAQLWLDALLPSSRDKRLSQTERGRECSGYCLHHPA